MSINRFARLAVATISGGLFLMAPLFWLSLLKVETQVASASSTGASVSLTAVSYSWASHGLQGMSVKALAIDPSDPTVVYAGGLGGVFKSTDGGATWNAVNSGLPSGASITSLAIDPHTPAIIYAGLGNSGGVFKSVNNGDQWSAINTNLTNTEVLALAINPVTPTTLYVGTFSGGLFKSVNSGATWNPTGLQDGSYVSAITVNPQTPTTVYAGISDDGTKVFKSVDAGDTWITDTMGLSGSFVNALVFDPITTTTLYAGISGNGGGIFKSIDGGTTWNMIGPDFFAQDMIIDPVAPMVVYVASGGGGVYRSPNDGATWSAFNTGLTNKHVYDLALSPAITPTLLAGTDDGVFMTQADFSVSGLSVAGPLIGVANTPYVFTATAQSITATLPVTYVWQATGQAPITHTSGLSDVVTYVWNASGLQTITMTAWNRVGAPLTTTLAVSVVVGAQTMVEPALATTLVYTDSRGNPTRVFVPAAATTQTIELIYAVMPSPTTQVGFVFAGHAFSLDAYDHGTRLTGFTFQLPITVTVTYSDAELVGFDESTLGLKYWNGTAWLDAASSCTPTSIYSRNTDTNQLSVPICHLTDFAVMGTEPHRVYLPHITQSP